MRFQDLLLFRRTRAGIVPLEVLRALNLPMPEDVLEQFLHDHGTNEQFQSQYGHLELCAMQWQLVSVPASDAIGCSVFQGFASYVTEKAIEFQSVAHQGWDNVPLPPGAALHWQQNGTWKRTPVALRGDLIGSDHPLHLVEGHTRLGVLRGLVESKVLSESSLHDLWIGERGLPTASDSLWRDILRKERMSFLDWLIGHVGNRDNLGKIASRLIEVKFHIWESHTIAGDDLPAVLAFANDDTILLPLVDTIKEAHLEWERLMSP